MEGKFSRIIAILKSAPRQIIGAYKKGRDDAPAVPPPEILPTVPKPTGKGSPRK